MTEDGITEGKYIETSDNTLLDLTRLILYRHLYKHKDHEVMRPGSGFSLAFFSLQLKLISLNH